MPWGVSQSRSRETMPDNRSLSNEKASAAALAVVEALSAFAEEPARWEDVIAAINGLPEALDPSRDATAQSISNHALRAASLAEKLNAGRRSREPASSAWDAVLVSGEARVRSAEALARSLAGVGNSGPSLTPITFSSADNASRTFAIVLAREAFPGSLTKTFGLGELWAAPPVAIVFLTSRDLIQDSDIVKQGLGLTAAEAKLAAQLGAGTTLADAASELGIAFHTARTQLKHIFAKTGARRQSKLVGLIGDLAIIAPRRAGDAQLPPLAIAPPRRFVDIPDGRRLF